MVRKTFKLIFEGWKLYLPVCLIVAVAMMILGMVPGLEAANVLYAILMFLVQWIMTIFITRHLISNKKIKLREVFFNAMTPLISCFVILLLVAIECLPLSLLTIAYSSAIETELFATFGYAVGFVIFAVAMISISAYLLPASVMSLVAVTAPGLYPVDTTSKVWIIMKGNRLKFWMKTLVLAVIIGLTWLFVWGMAAVGVPEAILAGFVTMLMCFDIMFAAVYYYIYYKQLLA
ncbi:hypothetical protein IJ117_02010 [Candidatus Saccharibacteria bacterium]|nr:hypothetical protein [Candidatus Saccharibacteria bacterium]